MYLMRFASFAWGVYHGYNHAPLVVFLAISAALAVGEMFRIRKTLFRNDGSKTGMGVLVGPVAFIFCMAFLASILSQAFGYLIGYFVHGAL